MTPIGPRLPDDVQDWLQRRNYQVDGFGFMGDFIRDLLLKDPAVSVLLREETPAPHPEIPPRLTWAGGLRLPSGPVYPFLLESVPRLHTEADIEAPEARLDVWTMLYTAPSWEEVDLLTEGRFAAQIEHARATG